MELPVLGAADWCGGCGRCCETIGMPPFEVPNPDLGPVPSLPETCNDQALLRAADLELFLTMPAGLRAGHAAAVLALDADPTGRPCLWLDPGTRRCRHYEYRPHVCRHFTPGGAACRVVRGHGAVVSWRGDGEMRPDDWYNPRSHPPDGADRDAYRPPPMAFRPPDPFGRPNYSHPLSDVVRWLGRAVAVLFDRRPGRVPGVTVGDDPDDDDDDDTDLYDDGPVADLLDQADDLADRANDGGG